MLLNILAECEKYQVLHLVTKFNLMSALCPGLRLHDNEYVSQVLKSLNRIYNILDTEGKLKRVNRKKAPFNFWRPIFGHSFLVLVNFWIFWPKNKLLSRSTRLYKYRLQPFLEHQAPAETKLQKKFFWRRALFLLFHCFFRFWSNGKIQNWIRRRKWWTVSG